uniref:TEP1-F n=1 Tax=Anopheles funestus TaxID=62324 RepID=A0A182S4J2_ANOFN
MCVRPLMVIIFVGAVHGILIVGPKFIRANQNYTVVVSNFLPHLSKVELIMRLEGESDDRTVLNVTEIIEVWRRMTKEITFNLPEDLSTGNYRIIIDGQRGFSFHKEADLVFLSKTISGLIQINKPVFKPGDTVQFRVIVLDTELKPPARIKTAHVTIRDPQNNVVRNWPSAELYTGVFESNLQIAPTPMLGMWNILVLVDGEELVTKTFEVKKYVLTSFDVEVVPTVVPLEKNQCLNLTIAANDHFGKPVKGQVKVVLYLEDDKRIQVREFEMYGLGQVNLSFNEQLKLYNDQQDVLVKTTFVEQFTERIVLKESQITVYKYPYRVELIKESPQFRPRLPFKCTLQFRYHDETPAIGITGKVKVMEVGYETTATTDDKGRILLELSPSDSTDAMVIYFSNDDDGFFFNEQVDKVSAVTDAYLKLELNSPVMLHSMLRCVVTCSDGVKFFAYYILTKGNIVDSGYIRTNQHNKHPFRFMATEKMLPKARIIVLTVANGMVVHDVLDIDFVGLRNNFELSIDKQQVKPGQQIELRMSGRPGAYVGLAVYDKSLLYYNANHDIFWKDVMQLYDGFHTIDENEFDKFHSTGLFVRTTHDIMFSRAHDMSARDGLQTSNPNTKLPLYRTNFLESWLWKNVTIRRSGTRTIYEVVPDSTTSWYLTGFSIDPLYGLGIIKKPIEFTTTLPFYIKENLPYSIGRGEMVALHFTLFNNREGEHTADVTLYNVANQMEFIGRPLEDKNYTKSVSIPPKISVPISFLVKARSLGEITVRIEATIKSIHERERLEKVIRVEPQSVLRRRSEFRFFGSDAHKSQTILINSPKNVDDSKKIEFRLYPNMFKIFTLRKLDDLLAVPSGDGEMNMVNFVPNIVVLDYLHAIGSKEQSLIDKATNLLRQGYQNQMLYRQTDGSFGVWQSNAGSIFLTAFVANSIQTASKYISEVDVAMVEKAYDWLASKQHSSGRFDEVGSVIHKNMQGGLRNGISLTSYVVAALLENENAKVKHATVIEKAMNYLSKQIESIQELYDLSIVTYALMLNGHSMRTKAFSRLLVMSSFANNFTEQYWRTTNSIETTAYALLSFVLAEKYLDGISVMNWLVNQRYVTGSIPHTQDTFVGLKALTKFSEKISPSRNNYTLKLKHKKATRYFNITSQDIYITDFEDIPKNTKSLEINVDGIGFGLLEVIYKYRLKLMNFENRFKLDVEKQNTDSDYELRLKVCANFIPEVSDDRSNMAVIEVYFPSGYVVDGKPISEHTFNNATQKIEIRYSGTSVFVYYNNMGIERNCFTVTAYRRFMVTLNRPAYVIVSDHFNPDWYATKLYEES